MLPDGGRICVEEVPPWRAAGDGHRIFCHIPLETLREFDPVVTTHHADGEGGVKVAAD